MTRFWQEWRGANDGRPSMFIRTLFSFRGYKLDLHKFVRADDPTCFHTHPAKALRLILWGGYVEERYPDSDLAGLRLLGFGAREAAELIASVGKWHEPRRTFVKWSPGWLGVVFPEDCHRIHSIRNGRSSYSLWFRWPKSAEIKIKGAC